MKTVDILSCGDVTPPLTALKSTAVSRLTTAKMTGTVSLSPSDYSSVAVLFSVVKGKPLCGGWFVTLALNLGTVSAFGLLHSHNGLLSK